MPEQAKAKYSNGVKKETKKPAKKKISRKKSGYTVKY